MSVKPVLLDEPARDAARHLLNESLLVEAGAGTGKTTLIVERVANLVDAGVPIEKIVAITFTEKAAGELKLRIRRALEERAAAGGAKARVALSTLERASIGTIHGFCARLLRESPVEAGVDPLFRVLDGNGMAMLFDEVWERWLARELNGDAATVPIAGASIYSPDEWVKELKTLARLLVEHRAELPRAIPDADPADPMGAVDAALAAIDAPALAAPCRKPEDDEMALSLHRLAKLRAELAAASPAARREILLRREVPLKGHNTWTKVGAVTRWNSKDALEAARAAAMRVQGTWTTGRALLAHGLCVRVAHWLAAGFVREYEAEKSRRSALDFDDLLVRARDLLRSNPSVRRRVRRGMRLILDEFQDTDPVQCETAFLLASESDVPDWERATPAPGALFLVGDPKQSIYAFRGADVETYSKARARFAAAGRVREISTNFRSREAVLSWINASFEKLLVAGSDDAAGWQIGYRPLDLHHAVNAEGSGVHFVRPPDGTDYDNVLQGRDEEARAVAALLRDHAIGKWSVRSGETSRPAGWRDVVVLLRNRKSSLPAFERAFRAAAIPYVVVGGRALWARAEVRALTALCRAIENPFDGVSVVAALKSAFFGASDAELLLYKHRHGSLAARVERAALDDGSTVGAALGLIARWHEDRLRIPAGRLLESVLTETGAIASFGLKPDGAQRVANLLRLLDAARAGAADAAGEGVGATGAPLSFRAWVDGLSERAADMREEAEGAVLEEDADAVRILTMHAAKGLEFPIVVLGDLSMQEPKGENRIFDRGTRRLAFKLSARKVGLETSNFEAAKEGWKSRQEAEDRRLLYVAATRAKDSLIVPLFPSRTAPSFFATLVETFPGLPGAAAGSIVAAGDGGPARMWVAGTDLAPVAGDPPVLRIPIDALEAALPESAGPAAPDADEQSLAARISARMRGRLVRSVTRILPRDADAPRAFTPPDTGLTADESAQVGIAVHAALEHGDLTDPDDLEKNARLEARARMLPPAAIERAARLARAAAALPLKDRLRTAARTFREWPFLLQVDGGPRGADASLLEGIVDLLWVEDGGLVILDWKTDAIPPGNEAAIAASVAHHEPQLLAYAWAASTLTGLPARAIVLALLDAGRAVERPVTAADLDRARAFVESGFAAAAGPRALESRG